jgi:lysine 2,3-aminomutase
MQKTMDKTEISQYNEQARSLGMLTIKVPPHYRQLVEEELETIGKRGGPLWHVAYPTAERMDQRAENEVPDFVEDRSNMPDGLENVLVHKYNNRALFLTTDICAGHCMYCFRQDVLTDIQGRKLPSTEEKLGGLVSYIRDTPHIKEAILSGGDPLSLPFRELEQIIVRLRSETDVRDIRMHTRNPVFSPQVLSERVCRLLGNNRVRVYLHIVHPYEIAEPVAEGLKMLKSCGARLYGQFPILRGVNDHCDVLARLIRMMDDLDITPINLFVPDPINFSAPFRIPMKRLLSLMDSLYWSTSSWNNGVRLVMDTPVGKVRREDISDWDEEKGIIRFRREGKSVAYHDFPEALDIPGDLGTLLWKG